MKSISFESIGMILLLMLFVLFCCIILVLIKIVARNCVCMFLFRCMVFSFVECSHSRLRTGKIAFLCSWTEWSTNTWLYKTMFNRTISAVASSVCHLCPSEYRQSKYQRTQYLPCLFITPTITININCHSNYIQKNVINVATQTEESQTQIPSAQSPCTPSSSRPPPAAQCTTKITRIIIINVIRGMNTAANY